MKRTPILIGCDAGAAGRDLLARRDLDLSWALTPAEIIAALTIEKPKMFLLREEMTSVLGTAPMPSATVVMVEPDGWLRREKYYRLGVTALVRASNRERILEAVSELTGLSFSRYPRVPYVDIVDVIDGDRHVYLETLELSTTGISVRYEEWMRVGANISVGFEMMDPPFRIPATVVRLDLEQPEPAAGICFCSVDDVARARLAAVVDMRQRELGPLPEPVGLTADLSGTFTLDLLASPTAALNDRLLLAEAEQGSVRLPSWMARVLASWTGLERSALRTGRPEFAGHAVDLRIELARARLDEGIPGRALADKILEFARQLGVHAAGSPQADLAQVPRIRAALLHGIYGTAAALRPRAASQSEARAQADRCSSN